MIPKGFDAGVGTSHSTRLSVTTPMTVVHVKDTVWTCGVNVVSMGVPSVVVGVIVVVVGSTIKEVRGLS